MTITTLFGDPVTLVRVATMDDATTIPGLVPDKPKKERVDAGDYYVIRKVVLGWPALRCHQRGYIRADGGQAEIRAALGGAA